MFFGLLLLVLGYFGYTKYQDINSLKGVVHQDAVSVIKLGMHDIKETLVLDALGSPGYYWKNIDFKSSSKEEKDEEDTNKGVDFIPHNLLGFTMPNLNNTIFVIWKIDDSSDFKKYLKKEFSQKIKLEQKEKSKAFETAKHISGNIILAWNTDKLVLAASPKLDFEKVNQIFKDLLLEDKFIYSTDNPLLKSIKKADGHLVYANSSGTSAVTFKDGNAILRGMHDIKTVFSKEVRVSSYQDRSFSMHYAYPFQEKSNKENLAKQLRSISFFTKNRLDVDSLIAPLDGHMSLAIAGTTTQNDTVITYGYDDNFEKVAQKTLKERSVPQIYLDLGGNSNDFINYLKKENLLGSQNIFKPFPLYQLQVTGDSSEVAFSTNFNRLVSNEKRSSYFFQLRTNFEKLQNDLDTDKTAALFSILRDLKIHAWQDDTVLIEGELRAKDEDTNILSQLFFGLKKEEKEKTEAEEL